MALDDETQIKEIFDYIDKDGDGEMDLQEFKEGFGYLKEKISQQRLARPAELQIEPHARLRELFQQCLRCEKLAVCL